MFQPWFTLGHNAVEFQPWFTLTPDGSYWPQTVSDWPQTVSDGPGRSPLASNSVGCPHDCVCWYSTSTFPAGCCWTSSLIRELLFIQACWMFISVGLDMISRQFLHMANQRPRLKSTTRPPTHCYLTATLLPHSNCCITDTPTVGLFALHNSVWKTHSMPEHEHPFQSIFHTTPPSR